MHIFEIYNLCNQMLTHFEDASINLMCNFQKQQKNSDTILFILLQNKVDTTYRCEALKEVMSFKCVKSQILKYLFTKHLHTKDTKCFIYFKMINISQTFDMKDIIDYVINRIVKVYNGYLPIQVSNHYTIAINRILKLSTWLLTYRTIYLLLEMLRI